MTPHEHAARLDGLEEVIIRVARAFENEKAVVMSRTGDQRRVETWLAGVSFEEWLALVAERDAALAQVAELRECFDKLYEGAKVTAALLEATRQALGEIDHIAKQRRIGGPRMDGSETYSSPYFGEIREIARAALFEDDPEPGPVADIAAVLDRAQREHRATWKDVRRDR